MLFTKATPGQTSAKANLMWRNQPASVRGCGVWWPCPTWPTHLNPTPTAMVATIFWTVSVWRPCSESLQSPCASFVQDAFSLVETQGFWPQGLKKLWIACLLNAMLQWSYAKIGDNNVFARECTWLGNAEHCPHKNATRTNPVSQFEVSIVFLTLLLRDGFHMFEHFMMVLLLLFGRRRMRMARLVSL